MRCRDLRWLSLLALAFAWASPAGAAEPAPPEFGPNGPVACYGRVYDADHMKTHPDQKIQRIFFFRGPDPVSRPNEQPPAEQSSFYSAFVAMTTRGASTPKWVGTGCDAMDAGDGQAPKIRCGRECDRTLGYLSRGPKGELVLSSIPRDLYLDPDSEETLGKAEYERQSFGKDDKDFHLDLQPVDVCKAEFARIDPPNLALGPPLRERLKVDQPFCYGRDYDAAHMQSHPAQETTTIRVYRGTPEIASYAAVYTGDRWPDSADVKVSMTTRHAAKTVTRTLNCQGEGDQWTCTSSQECEDENRQVFLRRDMNGGMALVNPSSGLPIVDICSRASRGDTKTDDKIFRMTPMPLAKCGL